MLRALTFVAAVVLVAAPGALAGVPPVEVMGAGGAVLGTADGSSFRYPQAGSLASVASVREHAGHVDLRGIELLGGRIQASRLTVGPDGRGTIENLVVDGLAHDASQNALFSLDSSSYLVVLQKAEIPALKGRNVGFVGLRLHLAPGYEGLPHGGEVLVGLSGGAAGRGQGRLAARKLGGARNAAATPWAALGFAGTPALATGTSFVTEPLSLLPVSGGTGARAVAIAERFLGVKYVWGGASPITGFDCSGLTQYVYHQLGISLTHFTGTQIHEGTPVPEPLLEPGDLVFFEPQSFGPGHVGIYVGGGDFIHAPHTGDVVKISSLSDSHYSRIYVGAVRPY